MEAAAISTSSRGDKLVALELVGDVVSITTGAPSSRRCGGRDTVTGDVPEVSEQGGAEEFPAVGIAGGG